MASAPGFLPQNLSSVKSNLYGELGELGEPLKPPTHPGSLPQNPWRVKSNYYGVLALVFTTFRPGCQVKSLWRAGAVFYHISVRVSSEEFVACMPMTLDISVTLFHIVTFQGETSRWRGVLAHNPNLLAHNTLHVSLKV